VVFVHGLWLHADSWGAWVDLFREAGYAPVAPGWPGDSATVEETRREPERLAGYGINEIVEHYAGIIEGLGAKPIVIGHSFGGLVVQRLLGQNLAAAAVAIDPAPIKGILYLPPSAFRVASIALRNPANRNRAVSLTRKQFRYGFGNAISEDESNDLYERWTIPSPGKPLFEDALANLSRRSPAKVDTTTRRAGLCSSSAAARIAPSPPPSASRPSSSTANPLRSRSTRSTPTEAIRSRSTAAGAKVADTALNWLKAHSP
jgi:non-heme chloroperoxidase